jgi:hypothetical protein
MGLETLQFDREIIWEKYGVEVDYDKAKEVVEFALLAYQGASDSKNNFYLGKVQPEAQFIQFLANRGEEDYLKLNSLFLATPLTFSGGTTSFFNHLSDEKEFKKYGWLFEPSVVAELPEDWVIDQAIKYFKPQGHQLNGIMGLHHNCVELIKYGGDVMDFLEYHDFDALKITQALFVKPRARSKEKEFWRFGPKLSILFMQWVDRYGLSPELKNVDNIGIPVDFEICRLAIQTGIVNIRDEVNAHNLSYNILLPMFIKLFQETGWKPRYASEALWALGSQGCAKERPRYRSKNLKCPVGDLCTGVYSKPRDNKGKFYSLDRMNDLYVPWTFNQSSY